MAADGRRGFRKLNLKIETFLLSYLQAETKISSIVAAAVLRGDLASPSVKRAVRRRVSDVLRDLNVTSIPYAARLTEEAYLLGLRIAGGTATRQAEDEALKLLIDSITNRLTDATVHIGRRVDDVFRKETLRAAALLGGEHIDRSKALERALENNGITSFRDSAGRNWRLSDYADMAIKTTTSEAVFHGSFRALVTEGLDLAEVNKVANPCDRCKEYDGKVFSLTGRTSGYPVLDIVFPIHPRCQHFIKAYIPRRVAA